MHQLATQLAAIEWRYATEDVNAKTELTRRIRDAGKRLGMITYSDLVRGIRFRLPSINNDEPFEIDVQDWSGFDRAMLGDFLGSISADSYIEAGFLATALVVNEMEFKPSEQFFKWMVDLGVLRANDDDAVLVFWIEHVNRAHRWYSSH